MENEISNKYIENAINELESLFGIKEPLFGENIFSLLRSNKVKDAMKLITRQLDLPIDINITTVPYDYGSQDGVSQFQTKQLVKVSHHGIQGSEGIIAQVSIPPSLPLYGSSALNGYIINVKISDNCTEHPVVFSMIMAHELSHILLYSLMHPKKENEFYTDLLAIMLGFQDIFQNGRKISTSHEIPGHTSTTIITSTTSYGYLSDEQFNFALNKINLILEKNKERKRLLLEEFDKYIKLLSKYIKTFHKFKSFIEYLTKNRNRNISFEDGKKLVTFFQPGYIDELELTIVQYEKKTRTIRPICKDIFHYTHQKINQISNCTHELQNHIEEIKNKQTKLIRDVKILSKYVSLRYRIKYFFQSRQAKL